MTEYINSIKGISSRILFQEFPEIKMKLWKGNLWSRSYCLLTTGQTTLDVLKRYVKSQGNDEDKYSNIDNKPIERKEYDNCRLCGWE